MGDDKLAADGEWGLVYEKIQGIRNGTFQAVFNGHNALIGHARVHGRSHRGYGRKGQQLRLGIVL